ncbi:MAG: hypothetical protein HYR84_13090 [Planctomycetes bacterium]|nr:hypothetical protein [Planctomycetota bacterium]
MAIVLFGAAGCGLPDYQDRLDKQSVRLQQFDDANRLLDDPIEMPRMADQDDPKTEKKAWPFDLFLRLPRGYSALPKEKTPHPEKFPLFRYSGGSEGATAIFVAAAWVVSGKDDKDEWDTYRPASFRSWVARGLEDYYKTTHKSTITFTDKVDPQPRDVKALTAYPNPSNPSKIGYKHYAYSDEGHRAAKDVSVFDIYLREEGGKQLAIVVQRPVEPINAAGFTKSIEACLGSLDLGGGTEMKRNNFKKAKMP